MNVTIAVVSLLAIALLIVAIIVGVLVWRRRDERGLLVPALWFIPFFIATRLSSATSASLLMASVSASLLVISS